jgi:hypothetical protein
MGNKTSAPKINPCNNKPCLAVLMDLVAVFELLYLSRRVSCAETTLTVEEMVSVPGFSERLECRLCGRHLLFFQVDEMTKCMFYELRDCRDIIFSIEDSLDDYVKHRTKFIKDRLPEYNLDFTEFNIFQYPGDQIFWTRLNSVYQTRLHQPKTCLCGQRLCVPSYCTRIFY